MGCRKVTAQNGVAVVAKAVGMVSGAMQVM